MCMEDKLPAHILSWINDSANEVFFSSASVWEIVIKHSKNPTAMPVDGNTFVNECIKAGFTPLGYRKPACACGKRLEAEKWRTAAQRSI